VLYNFITYLIYYGIGDWGLGIGDCPIPNPQSPIPKININTLVIETTIITIIP